jgi:hypothetical protein
MAPDLLSTIRAEIAERMDGLRPLIAEHERLLVAADTLESTRGNQADVATNGATAPRSRPAKRTATAASQASKAAPGGAHDGRANETASDKAPRLVARRTGESSPKPARAARGAAREAILAALEHGSHTVGELSVVTAMGGPNINGNLRRLAGEGVVAKTEREGKTAWSLVESLV